MEILHHHRPEGVIGTNLLIHQNSAVGEYALQVLEGGVDGIGIDVDQYAFGKNQCGETEDDQEFIVDTLCL